MPGYVLQPVCQPLFTYVITGSLSVLRQEFWLVLFPSSTVWVFQIPSLFRKTVLPSGTKRGKFFVEFLHREE